MIMIMT